MVLWLDKSFSFKAQQQHQATPARKQATARTALKQLVL
jgi:hypothetical protein